MSRAKLGVLVESSGCVITRMDEHDLLEAVEIEESTGLSQWGWDAYRAELGKPEAIMLVARRRMHDELGGREVCGFIATRLNADELHVNNLGVRQDSRRRGIGGALLGAALDAGTRRGARLAVLEVRSGNLEAQALYRRFGFAVVGERRHYYKEPVENAIIMTRQLVPTA